MRSGPVPAGGRDRSQTAVDFAVGMSLFLLTVGFVFGFAPTIFDPFTTDAGGKLVIADRSADRLSSDLLVGSVTTPSVLNTTCTTGFFDANGAAPAGCRYDGAHEGANLADALGVDQPAISLNVSITDDGSVRTVDGTQLSVGPSPPSNADVAQGERLVLLENAESELVVRVW